MIKKSQSGFTLLELMIVVIIIGILAMVAIPSYRHYVTRSWETRAKSALQENALFLEKINARFYGFTKVRTGNRQSEKISDDDLPVKILCTGSDCSRNYQFKVYVADDLSQYILLAYPTGSQAKSSTCGAFIIDSSGGQYAKYLSGGNYSVPSSINAGVYGDPTKVKEVISGGTDKSSDCFK